MINQLKAIVGFKEEEIMPMDKSSDAPSSDKKELDAEF